MPTGEEGWEGLDQTVADFAALHRMSAEAASDEDSDEYITTTQSRWLRIGDGGKYLNYRSDNSKTKVQRRAGRHLISFATSWPGLILIVTCAHAAGGLAAYVYVMDAKPRSAKLEPAQTKVESKSRVVPIEIVTADPRSQPTISIPQVATSPREYELKRLGENGKILMEFKCEAPQSDGLITHCVPNTNNGPK